MPDPQSTTALPAPTRPKILGIGGTLRPGSATERILRLSLSAAETLGADVELIAGADLDLAMYVPGSSQRGARETRLIRAFRECAGVIIATPAYHGSISGLVKNALDYTEDLRSDARVYFDGCAVGCICCAGGWQAAGQALTALRAIAHSLRGWPTPLGVMVNTSLPIFDERGTLKDEAVGRQLEIVGEQVFAFAQFRTVALPGSVG